MMNGSNDKEFKKVKTKIVLFGTGYEANCFVYQYKNQVDIEYCLDNDREKQGKSFHGYEIKAPIIQNIDKKFIVIASSYYDEIKISLKSMGGCVEFRDFIYKDFWNRKVVVLHGNCHLLVIKEYLKSSKEFLKEYAIYDVPNIYEIGKGGIDKNLLEHCDLFIHQDIRKDNGFGFEVSDEYILPKLSEKCIKVVIPNLYGFGHMLFPQIAVKAGAKPNDVFRFRDVIIDKYISEVNCLDDIIECIKTEAIFSEEEIQQGFDNLKEKLYKREMNWDIKIADFLFHNFTEYKCFYEPWHPTNFVLCEIANRLLRQLGYEACLQEHAVSTNLDGNEVPVYPCVSKILNLRYENKILRKNCKKCLGINEMNLEEYIRQYVFLCS